MAKTKKAGGPIPTAIKEQAEMYFDREMSLREIAAKFDTYPKKIERGLKAHGFELRGRSQAQSQRIASGKCEHPTKGKELSESTKIKISNKIHESWAGISKEEMEKRKSAARKRLNNRADKEDMIAAGFEGINKAAKSGSKLEIYLADQLMDAGYMVLIHQKHNIEDKNMHLDIFLPDNNIAIEVDGPSHWSPVWSKEDLAKSQARDSKKNGLLIANGYDIIRLKSPKNVSMFFSRLAAETLIATIEKIIKLADKKAHIHNIDLV